MYNIHQYAERGRKLIDCTCDRCGKEFQKEKRKIHFSLAKGSKGQYCSKKCSIIPAKKKECGVCHSEFTGTSVFCSRECWIKSCEGPKKERTLLKCALCEMEYAALPWQVNNGASQHFCSKKCLVEYRARYAGKSKPPNQKTVGVSMVDLKCGQCLKEFSRPAYDVKKPNKLGKHFCSGSCRIKYINRNCNPTKFAARSKPQAALFGIIGRVFPDLTLVNNDRETLECRYELDIWMPTIKFAIEINGPTHYMPIYGEKSLEAIKQRDAIKYAEAHAKGISLLIIDVSRLQKHKIQSFMEEQFESIVKPIILSKLDGRHSGDEPEPSGPQPDALPVELVPHGASEWG